MYRHSLAEAVTHGYERTKLEHCLSFAKQRRAETRERSSRSNARSQQNEARAVTHGHKNEENEARALLESNRRTVVKVAISRLLFIYCIGPIFAFPFVDLFACLVYHLQGERRSTKQQHSSSAHVLLGVCRHTAHGGNLTILV